MPYASDRISFAHNARTICIAFVAFAARYRQGNIVDQDLSPIFNAVASEYSADSLYEAFKEIGQLQYFLPPQLFADKSKYDATLSKLFTIVINAGITSYRFECRHDSTLTATNYLKRDKNYYDIIGMQWSRTKEDIAKVFEEAGL